MNKLLLISTVAVLGFLGAMVLTTAPASAAGVKITALGSHDGEMCRRDRAFLFEDPTGTRILFDAGRTIAGAKDPRLGKIDVVLLSSVHSDHLGDRHIASVNAGTCAKPKTSVKATPHSLTALIAVAKKSKVVTGGQMRGFLRAKVKAAGGSKKQLKLVRFGGKRKIGGVTIAIVPTVHSNGVSPSFLNKKMAEAMKPDGLTAYAGPDNGYILKFSNGLVVYVSGDTGITAEMETLVRRYYKAELAIIAIGDIFTMGPEEASWAVNELIKPKAVIPMHFNEAATKGGKLKAKSKVAKFKKMVKVPVHLPLSGKTMEFDGNGTCTAGC
ncbi:MAG: MBL fold metallo-hydrolase [Alphaproteobacteria bacterium]